MMNKKGVELSMNVIIIAAIGMLVLIILSVLVINALKNVNEAKKTCNLKGGICAQSCESGMIQDGVCGENQLCCKEFTTG